MHAIRWKRPVDDYLLYPPEIVDLAEKKGAIVSVDIRRVLNALSSQIGGVCGRERTIVVSRAVKLFLFSGIGVFDRAGNKELLKGVGITDKEIERWRLDKPQHAGAAQQELFEEM